MRVIQKFTVYTKTFQSWPLSLQDYKFTSQSEIFCFNSRGSSRVFPCFPYIYIYIQCINIHQKSWYPDQSECGSDFPQCLCTNSSNLKNKILLPGSWGRSGRQKWHLRFLQPKMWPSLSLSLSGGLGSNPSFRYPYSYLLPAQKHLLIIYCQK